MSYPTLKLKPGREAATGFHHPWVFSGALENIPEGIHHGNLIYVADRNNRIIGTGTFSTFTAITVRLLAFEETVIDQAWLTARIRAAGERRRLMGYGHDTQTTGYRVVFGEADQLPGLIIDRYADVIVMQISTAGMDRLRDKIIAACQEVFSPRAIVERSDIDVRTQERLEPVVATHHGELTEPVQFIENGLQFVADTLRGQKTGFYLDQRELRAQVKTLAGNRSVLNLFSYSGATSVAALAGGASSAHNVDSGSEALILAQKHAALNGLAAETMTTEEADVFAWLNDHKKPEYDMVILDPPALTKSKREVESAAKAYHFLNRAALRLVKPGGIFVTSSCSRFFSEDDLAFTLRRASVQAGKNLDILYTIRQAPDHPLSIYFPESAYLKSFIGVVN